MESNEYFELLIFATGALAPCEPEPASDGLAGENPGCEAERLLRELREGADEMRAWLGDFGQDSRCGRF